MSILGSLPPFGELPSHLTAGTPENNALQEEWETISWLAEISDDPIFIRQARRWVLIQAFGSTSLFHNSPEFHARVHLAAQMLSALDRTA